MFKTITTMHQIMVESQSVRRLKHCLVIEVDTGPTDVEPMGTKTKKLTRHLKLILNQLLQAIKCPHGALLPNHAAGAKRTIVLDLWFFIYKQVFTRELDRKG